MASEAHSQLTLADIEVQLSWVFKTSKHAESPGSSLPQPCRLRSRIATAEAVHQDCFQIAVLFGGLVAVNDEAIPNVLKPQENSIPAWLHAATRRAA